MRRRLVGLGVAAVVSVAACSDDPGYVELPVETTTPDDDSAAAPRDASEPAEVEEGTVEQGADEPAAVRGDGLLLVLDRDGGERGLAVYRPDGTLVSELAESDADALVWQPIWSPDATRLAWAASNDGATWELVTSGVDGSDRTSHALPARPEYLTFDPTGGSVLALTPSAQGFGVVIADLGADNDGSVGVVDVGRPYYSDFSPEGDRFIAHAGSSLRIVGLDGETSVLDFTSNGHQTPTWHPDGESLLFAVDDGAGNVLVRHHLPTDTTLPLGTFQRFVLFAVDPTGAHVAVSSFGGEPESGTSAIQSPPGDRGGLFLIELESGATTRVAERPSSAPMWNADGTHFLVRTTVLGTGEWHVYDLAGEMTTTGTFDVSDTLAPAYLPFWDQFGRSQTVWSPDGARFVHVGASAEGQNGVWIQEAAASGGSTFVIDGDVAFWSPA